MGLHEVQQEILTEAQRKADALHQESQQQFKASVAKALEDYKQKLLQDKAAFENSLTLLEKRELASAMLEARKNIFEVKKQLLQEVYDRAYARLTSLPAAERKLLLQRLLEKAKHELPVSTVFLNSEDKSLLSESATVTHLAGGIIAENKEGTIRVDYSLETLFMIIKEKTMADVAKLLFGA
ncbi:hypothetical protein HYY69_07065 [Candidatus Woesearchaeota archaeon]|nr:hypothetical protein [Candidatus Woesearchaeota archaeon]